MREYVAVLNRRLTASTARVRWTCDLQGACL